MQKPCAFFIYKNRSGEQMVVVWIIRATEESWKHSYNKHTITQPIYMYIVRTPLFHDMYYYLGVFECIVQYDQNSVRKIIVISMGSIQSSVKRTV